VATPFSRTTRALSLESPRYALIGLGLAGAVLVAWLGWFAAAKVTLFEPSRQARIEVESLPRDVATLSAGRLTASRLKLGQRVRAGDVLAELDARAETLRLAETEARLEAYPAKVAALRGEIAAQAAALRLDNTAARAEDGSARARINAAEAAAAFAREFAERQRAESAAGGAARIDALRADAEALKASAARLAAAADARRAALSGQARGRQGDARIEDLTLALLTLETDWASTQQAAAGLRLAIAERRIRAPVDGVVGDVRPLAAGAVLAAGQPLASIVPDGQLMIVAQFDPARALGRLKAGQTARFRLDGFGWPQVGLIEARVARVAGEPRDNQLRAELTLTGAQARGLILTHGMTGRAEVAVDSLSPAALVLRLIGAFA
jgi:membrane fusion protein (multidrug efflux system)